MNLVLPFDSDDPEFTRGVEVGMLWELLKEPGEVEATIHATNAEMAMRLAEASGRTVVGESLGEDFIFVAFSGVAHGWTPVGGESGSS